MKIILAEYAGFCGGVKRAVELAEHALRDGPLVTHGELIHNTLEVARLERLGLHTSYDGEIGTSKRVLIRAHGITREEFAALEKENIEIIDATCPIVMSIHQKVREKSKEGYAIVVIGDPEHPEVRAILSQADEAYAVSNEDEARNFKMNKKIYILSQTTNREEYFNHLASLVAEGKDAVIENTICSATRLRQKACAELAGEVDAMIVIGGKNSSNTRKLHEIARKHCKESYHIESISQLPLHNLEKFNIIGVTAGASTPGWLIEEVIRRMDQFSNEELMEEMEGTFTNVRAKEIVTGKVIYVTDNEVMVNIGYKSDGIIKRDELSDDQSVTPKDLFKEGDEIEVYVIKLDDGEGNVVLSSRRVAHLKNWEVLAEMQENGETVDAVIEKEVKGGLICTVKGIGGFIPGSQVAIRFVRDLKPFVGQTLTCDILSVDPRKRRLVLSRRSVIERERKEIEDKVWNALEIGQMIHGKVARLTDFGAFVDIGGVDGLLHVSDISWNRINHPSEALNVGDELELQVLRANRERGRISLGLKQLQPKPFDVFAENNKVGDIVTGTVVNLVAFGAFVRLKEGVEGLVHVSEISYARVEKPSDELNIGEEVEVKILGIDEEHQRIALSIKQTKEDDRPKEERPKRERKPRRREPRMRAPMQVTSASKDLENVQFGNSVLGDLDLGSFGFSEDDLATIEENQEENAQEEKEQVAQAEEVQVEEEAVAAEEATESVEAEETAEDCEDSENCECEEDQ